MTSFRELAEFLDPVAPARTLRRLFAMHRWQPGTTPSFAVACRRHTATHRIDQRLLWQNTFLLSNELGIGSKPHRAERGRAIGALIRARFDIGALCEIFTSDEAQMVLAAFPPGSPIHHTAINAGSMESSGLVTLVNGLEAEILEVRGWEYHHESGSDSLADKAVLVVELIFPGRGFGGNLEVWSTHLQADDEATALAQLRELVAKFPLLHRPANAAILVGDFNIEASHPRAAEAAALLASVGFRDLWVARNGTPGFTEIDSPRSGQAVKASGAIAPIADAVCPLDGPGSIFCDDARTSTTAPLRNRLDYVYLLDPDPAQRITVDVTRPRRVRRAFQLLAPASVPANASDVMDQISDHLGLAVTLRLTP